MGEDDYTRRLHFHVERILQNQPITLPNIDAKMSYITDEEAAEFLYFSGVTPIEGPTMLRHLGGHISQRPHCSNRRSKWSARKNFPHWW